MPHQLRRILIIDDDDAHRLLVRRALRNSRAEIVEVSSLDGAHAALLAEAHALDLVILDMNLKGKPGLDVLGAFRAGFSFERLPIILLSTSALNLDVQLAYQAGANCYILKETDPLAFNHALAQAVRFFIGP
ncbi:MAG: response regulator [Proteobacteria bacterium]|nr:response regulator [Pseudomonadota bacterium]